jgi:SPP1 gp7 family putative phage head morphogenesis protein
MANLSLFDSILEMQLHLNRLDANTRAEVIAIFQEMERELFGVLSDSDLTRWGRARVNKLLSQAEEVINNYYEQVQLKLFDTLDGVSNIVTSQTVSSMQGTVPVSIEVSIPTPAMVEGIAGSTMFEGAVIADWLERQSEDTIWRFKTAVQQGMVSGEDNGAIISRVRQAISISRANAASLVQTSVSSISNAARSKVFEENSKLISSMRWITALDSHVCVLCAARADKVWDMKTKEPKGHDIAYRVPPIHFNDRCVLVPVTKTWAELGINIPEIGGGSRASEIGQVPEGTTFDDFLRRRGTAFQNEVLGSGRADMWRSGKITLADLISGNGRPLTLAELREIYA